MTTLRDDLPAALRAGPFHVALRTAIEVRGLSLQRLRHRLSLRGLRIGVTSLSYWQQGLRRPERPESLRVVRALEEILELPPASLIALLGPPRSRGRNAGLPPGAVGYAALLSPADVLDRILSELDSDDGKLHTIAMYETVQIGPDRSAQRRGTLQVVRAHADPADRYVMVWTGQPGCEVERVELAAGDNCRLGRVRRHSGHALIVAELLFDHVLHAGDTYILGYELTDPSGVECPEYERGFRFPSAQYVLQIRFDADALPVRCHQFTRRHADGPERIVRPLVLNAHRTVHLAETELRPGVLGIHWSWT
jgi:hypothetical protein